MNNGSNTDNSVNDKKKNIHDKYISFGEINDKNIGQLKIINEAVFPIVYHQVFYDSIVQKPTLSTFAYYNDVLVGSVCCSLEKSKDIPNKYRLYIMTLGVLSPYRRCGIGSKLIEFVFDKVKSIPNVYDIYLNVHVKNEDAIKFYEKFGFEIVETIPDYYKQIQPTDAHVLRKVVEQQQ